MKRICSLILLSSITLGCHSLDLEEGTVNEKLSSAVASFVDFRWEGEVYDENCFRPWSAIDQQLLYTVGQLNGDDSVGRLDQVEISNMVRQDVAGQCKITYTATMPVAWGERDARPDAYELILPRNVSWDGMDSFVEKYTKDCLDWGAYDVTPDVFWYYYRPARMFCELDDDDVFRFTAAVTPSEDETEGMYPEYHKVWEDEALNVVAIFGRAKEGAGEDDVGARGYRQFVELVAESLAGPALETEPENLSEGLKDGAHYAVVRNELGVGKTVNVHTFFIESVDDADDDFWAKYEGLTPKADYIIYNGHSGLGQNIRTLAGRGQWVSGQYVIVFMNGCDTFAYIDSALADAHSAVNADDPNGTKYLDVVANAMPSMFVSMPEATMAIFDGLLSYDAPQTYEEILSRMSDYQVALVTGENDNEFRPGSF